LIHDTVAQRVNPPGGGRKRSQRTEQKRNQVEARFTPLRKFGAWTLGYETIKSGSALAGRFRAEKLKICEVSSRNLVLHLSLYVLNIVCGIKCK
jgi:hypothetical protein